MKDLDETERIVFNEIKNSAHESAEAMAERVRNFPNIDILQMADDYVNTWTGLGYNIAKVASDPDAAYSKGEYNL
ncbi:hypothetical protein [Paenibacillus kribbensis]|uniref:hypothetical protein n=1 Tax=Paenibacillus kribbensis TaxID=172713 RepID=UPI0008387A5A|nr:hypothetical protein [Paenibacillus kribbensis]